MLKSISNHINMTLSLKMPQKRKNSVKSKVLDTILALAVITCIVIAIPFVIAHFNNSDPETSPSHIHSVSDIVSLCQGKDLEDASNCAVNITKGFYKYNLSNLGLDLSFYDLKDQGGVCANWSEYYTDLGSKLGFNANNVIIPTDLENNLYHEFSVWSADSGYCVLDQTELTCTSLQ